MKVIFLFPDNLWLTLEIDHIPRENNLINFKNLEAKSFDCNEDFNDFKISKNENKNWYVYHVYWEYSSEGISQVMVFLNEDKSSETAQIEPIVKEPPETNNNTKIDQILDPNTPLIVAAFSDRLRNCLDSYFIFHPLKDTTLREITVQKLWEVLSTEEAKSKISFGPSSILELKNLFKSYGLESKS